MEDWLDSYKGVAARLLEEDPEFARWLNEAYVPIAGGWAY